MYTVCFAKHILERGVIVIHILEEPLLGELLLGHGLCEGLDISLHEVVVFGLITCEEVGVVKRVHTFEAECTGSLRSSKLWKESRRDCRILKENEKKRKLDGMESSKSKSDARYMHG